MFAFRKRNKKGGKTTELLDRLRNNPGDAKTRLRLADLYLREGDKKSAIREYQTAASHLREEGFNLKAISIYKKLFSLDGMSLNDYKCLASIYAESGLFAEARRTYEKILHIKPHDRETQEAFKRLEHNGHLPLDQGTKDIIEHLETPTGGNSDAVPIETLLAPSPDPESLQSTPEDLFAVIHQGTEEDSSFTTQGTPKPATTDEDQLDPRIDMGVFQIDDFLGGSPALSKEQEPRITESPTGTKSKPQESFQGKLLRDVDLGDLSDEQETVGGIPDSDTGQNSGVTFGAGFAHPEDMASPLETTHPPADTPSDSHEPFIPDTAEDTPGPSGEDPDLHYNLGVAYREMDLTDRAIEEFTTALQEGNKPLECLTMLAKCYFEEGLFREAAKCIHRALRFESLTRAQIDQLHRQLEEAEAVGKLG